METPYPKPINPNQTRIGWIGIGVMGQAIATRLISAGYLLTVYARTPEKASSLQQKGAIIVNLPSDVANKSDIVFTMVGHPSDVRSVVLGDNGVLSGLNKGVVFIDTTSSDPVLAKEIASKSQLKGCFAIDSPVSGGDIGARNGKLAILAGGDSDIVKWLSPVYEVLGRVTYVGGSGCGQSCKIAKQITVGANLLMLEVESLDQLTRGTNRKKAAHLFYQTLGVEIVDTSHFVTPENIERLGYIDTTDLGFYMFMFVIREMKVMKDEQPKGL